MFCRACNRDVPGNPEYCPYCGSRLNKKDNNVGQRLADRSVKRTLGLFVTYAIMFVFTFIAFICGIVFSSGNDRTDAAMGTMTASLIIKTIAWVVCLVYSILVLKNMDYYVKKYHFEDRKAKVLWILGIIFSAIFLIMLWVFCMCSVKGGVIAIGILQLIVCAGCAVLSFLVWRKVKSEHTPTIIK